MVLNFFKDNISWNLLAWRENTRGGVICTCRLLDYLLMWMAVCLVHVSCTLMTRSTLIRIGGGNINFGDFKIPKQVF
jgi:hypothetical protein